MEERREGRGLANPPGVLGERSNEERWQIYVRTPPSPPVHACP